MELLSLIHSLWRWIVLLLVLAAVLASLWKWRQGAAWENPDRRLPLWTTIAIDIQVLIGIILWIGEGRWSGTPFFTSILHPIIMLGALGVAHMTMSRSRSQRGPARHRTVGLGLLLALVLIVLGIPRDAWMPLVVLVPNVT